MGWTSYHAQYYTKSGRVDRKRECDAYWLEGLNAGHFAVVKSSMVRATYYAAIRPLLRRTGHNDEFEAIPEAEQDVYAVIFLTQTNQRDYYNFAYKDMGETMGPEARCPVGILKCLSQTENKTALAWREKCKEYAEQVRKYRKSREKLNALPLFTWISFVADQNYGNGVVHAGDTVTIQKRCVGLRTFWSDGHYRWPSKFIPTDFTVVQ